MPAKLQITISDDTWPYLTIVSQLETAEGTVTVSKDKFQYDVAGSQAESISNNMLSRAVNSVVKERKRKQNPTNQNH